MYGTNNTMSTSQFVKELIRNISTYPVFQVTLVSPTFSRVYLLVKKCVQKVFIRMWGEVDLIYGSAGLLVLVNNHNVKAALKNLILIYYRNTYISSSLILYILCKLTLFYFFATFNSFLDYSNSKWDVLSFFKSAI